VALISNFNIDLSFFQGTDSEEKSEILRFQLNCFATENGGGGGGQARLIDIFARLCELVD
jgi:hypothetical protein